MGSQVIKPNKIFYGVPPAILIIGIILFIFVLVSGIFSSIEKINHQVVVPGSKIIELKEVGKYTIFFEYRSIIDGKVYETSNINGLKCSLQNVESGEFTKLSNSEVNSNYSVSGREGKSIFNFVINEPGKYEIKGWYESGAGEEAVLAIGKGFGGALVRTVLLSISILFGSFGISVAIFIYIFVKRTKYKKLILKQQEF